MDFKPLAINATLRLAMEDGTPKIVSKFGLSPSQIEEEICKWQACDPFHPRFYDSDLWLNAYQERIQAVREVNRKEQLRESDRAREEAKTAQGEARRKAEQAIRDVFELREKKKRMHSEAIQCFSDARKRVERLTAYFMVVQALPRGKALEQAEKAASVERPYLSNAYCNLACLSESCTVTSVDPECRLQKLKRTATLIEYFMRLHVTSRDKARDLAAKTAQEYSLKRVDRIEITKL